MARALQGSSGGGGGEAVALMRTQPHNLEAEQALLGAVLVNNEAFHRVSEFLKAEHFFEPVHQRIFAACAERIGRGQLADARSLFHLFDEDPALEGLDGAKYLGRIARAAVAMKWSRSFHRSASASPRRTNAS